MEVSEQVDLASFIGLITGTGLPSKSLGVPSSYWLQTYWSDDVDRIRIIQQLLRHFGQLMGCLVQKQAINDPARMVEFLNPHCHLELLDKDQGKLFI